MPLNLCSQPQMEAFGLALTIVWQVGRTGKPQSSGSQMDYRMTRRSLCFRMITAESGFRRLKDSPISVTADLLPQMQYLVETYITLFRIKRATSGFLKTRASCTCAKGDWSNRFRGLHSDGTNKPTFYSRIQSEEGRGLDSGLMGACPISRMASSERRTQRLMA